MASLSKRSTFSSRIGFVLAAAGSAVGLGNIWRFPYLAAKYGGGTFLLVYIILAVTFGFSLMIAEIALGRKTRLSAIGAYRALNRKCSFIGVLSSVIPIIIVPYYCVIGGWVTKYIEVYLTGQGPAAASDTFFNSFISSSVSPLVWLAVFVLAAGVIVFLGVEKGIEKASKILMPALVILTLIIVGFTLTMENAGPGIAYYFIPDFSKFSVNLVLAALGQLFYSMSLAMGIMITYGSYMPKDTNLEKSVSQIELFDTGIAILAGLMIVPAVFAFSGGDETMLQSGPSLMFITLPKVFQKMPLGNVVGALFFILVFFAALTSAISLLETVISIFADRLKCSRKVICVGVVAFTLLAAIPSSLGFGVWSGFTIFGFSILDFFDFLSNSVLMPIVAFLTCIFIGFVVKPKTIIEEVELSAKFRRKKMFVVIIKYVAPLCIIAILVSSVLNAFGVISL